MRNASEDGHLQVLAATSLLENSRLVEWMANHARFVPVPREIFEYSIRRDVDPVFGRLICWILFSAGAEFLAKGICLIKGVEIRSEQEVPPHPTMDLDKWVSEFRKNWKVGGTMTATYFGTLGNLTHDNSKSNIPAALTRLCSVTTASPEQKNLLFSTYEVLRRTIRNRDAHAYIPNVRDAHYSLVPDLFCRCFNLLVSWLPNGPNTLNIWKTEAEAFVTSL